MKTSELLTKAAEILAKARPSRYNGMCWALEEAIYTGSANINSRISARGLLLHVLKPHSAQPDCYWGARFVDLNPREVRFYSPQNLLDMRDARVTGLLFLAEMAKEQEAACE